MKKCRHDVKFIKIETRYDSSPDGYGGTSEWEWEVLTCSSCKTEERLGCNSVNLVYESITGRKLDFKELCKIFKKNRYLYRRTDPSLEMEDKILRTVGRRTDILGRQIKAKKKLIKKHKSQLEKMLKDYNGTDQVSYLEEYD